MRGSLPAGRYADIYFGAPSKWEAFVDICLNWHLHPGGRIGGYMVVPKYPTRADCTAYMFPYEAVVSKVCFLLAKECQPLMVVL